MSTHSQTKSVGSIFDESAELGKRNSGLPKWQGWFEEVAQEDGRKNINQREHLLGKCRVLWDELQKRDTEKDDDNLVVVEEEERR